MEKLIWVKSADPNVVGCFDRDDAHPDGEVFVSGDAAFQCAPTQAIRDALKAGRLVEATDPNAPVTPAKGKA